MGGSGSGRCPPVGGGAPGPRGRPEPLPKVPPPLAPAPLPRRDPSGVAGAAAGYRAPRTSPLGRMDGTGTAHGGPGPHGPAEGAREGAPGGFLSLGAAVGGRVPAAVRRRLAGHRGCSVAPLRPLRGDRPSAPKLRLGFPALGASAKSERRWEREVP